MGLGLLLAAGWLHEHRLLRELLALCFFRGDSAGPLPFLEEIHWTLSPAACPSHAWSAPGTKAGHAHHRAVCTPCRGGLGPHAAESHPGLVCLPPLLATCHLFLSEILDLVLHEQSFGDVLMTLLLLLLFNQPQHPLYFPSWNFSSNNIPDRLN